MEVYLALGSNEGTRSEYLSAAESAISKRIGHIVQKSSVYETAAWGKEDEPAFLNSVLKVETKLTAQMVLRESQQIESELKRLRKIRWGARTIDIDLLFYDDEIIREPELTIPHPLLHLRRFVLIPLNEINPNLIHPVLKESLNDLLKKLDDPLSVRRRSS